MSKLGKWIGDFIMVTVLLGIGSIIGLTAGMNIITGMIDMEIAKTKALEVTEVQQIVADRVEGLEVRVADVEYTISVGDGAAKGTWNGEHDALQPATGYRTYQVTHNPQRTIEGQ